MDAAVILPVWPLQRANPASVASETMLLKWFGTGLARRPSANRRSFVVSSFLTLFGHRRADSDTQNLIPFSCGFAGHDCRIQAATSSSFTVLTPSMTACETACPSHLS